MKKTFEEVKQYFEANGCELLDTEYKNAHVKMRYKCFCGNESSINLNNFKSGKRCGCGRIGLKRLTSEQIKTEVEARGCKFISEIFACDTHLVTCICKCGKVRNCSLIDLRRSSGCENCRNKQLAIGFEVVKETFAINNCELLENDYKNIYEPLKFRCSCGLIEYISFDRFRKAKACSVCKPKKDVVNLSGENHYKWRTDRDNLKSEQFFRNRCKGIVRNALRSLAKTKDETTEKLLGYTAKQLREHIFAHPNWDLVKNGKWHVDHKFPIRAFLDHGISDLKIINCLENLQPISEYDNLSKNCKYDKIEFSNWLQSKLRKEG